MSKKKFKPLRYDDIFKTVFNVERFMKRFLKETLDLEVNDFVLVHNEMTIENKNEKVKKLDLIIYTDKAIINLEINNNHNPGLLMRNLLYLFKLMGSSIDKKSNYLKVQKHIQLNLTWNLKKYLDYDISNKKCLRYSITDQENNQDLTDKVEIIIYNMDYYAEKCYNENNQKDKFMMLLSAKKIEEMRKISKGDSLMEEITDLVEKLNADLDIWKKIAIENDGEKLYESYVEYGKEQGIKKGIEQGMKKGIEQE